jgi:hypothetical protein
MLRPYIYKYPSFVKKLNKFQKDFFVSYGIHIFVETNKNTIYENPRIFETRRY